MGRVTKSQRVTTVRRRDGVLYHSTKPRAVAAEEPLSIRLYGRRILETMRTPGHDLELAHGHLYSQGLIRSASDIVEARYCDGATLEDESGMHRNTYNVMDFSTRAALGASIVTGPIPGAESCAVSGSGSIDQLVQGLNHDFVPTCAMPASALFNAHNRATRERTIFHKTGGVHAAALVTASGEVQVLREDVRAENAVDKVIGWGVLNARLPLQGAALVVSSRGTFDVVRKAALAGIELVACAGAATSLAIDTATRLGLTLCAFDTPARESSAAFTIYTAPERIDLSESAS